MKKILFLIKSLEGGGAEKVLINYLNGLDEKKYDITVLTVFNTGVYINDLPKYVKYKTLMKRPTKNKMRLMQRILTYLPDRLLRLIFMKENTYDIEISFLEGNQCKLISSAPNDTKKIAWIHLDILKVEKTGFKNYKDEFNTYKNFDEVICVSNDVKDNFEKKFNNKITCKTIYNPIDKNSIIKEKAENTFITNKRINICSIGRLVEAKRFDRLIESTKLLVDAGYDVKTTILGEGVLRKDLENLIKKLNLEEIVDLKGFIKNPYKYLANQDIFVCSSDNEGFSLVVAEAMILGIPVISTDCSGPIELLDNGNYGIIVNKSSREISNAVSKMIDNNELLKYHNLSLERSKIFGIDQSINQLIKLMEE